MVSFGMKVSEPEIVVTIWTFWNIWGNSCVSLSCAPFKLWGLLKVAERLARSHLSEVGVWSFFQFSIFVFLFVWETARAKMCVCLHTGTYVQDSVCNLPSRLYLFRSVTGTFLWRRSLKSLPRQHGMHPWVWVTLRIYVFVWVNTCRCLRTYIHHHTFSRPTPPSSFSPLFFHSSVKTSLFGVESKWLAAVWLFSVLEQVKCMCIN